MYSILSKFIEDNEEHPLNELLLSSVTVLGNTTLVNVVQSLNTSLSIFVIVPKLDTCPIFVPLKAATPSAVRLGTFRLDITNDVQF